MIYTHIYTYTRVLTSHNTTTGSNIKNELIVNIALISSMTTGTLVCCILEGKGDSESQAGMCG